MRRLSSSLSRDPPDRNSPAQCQPFRTADLPGNRTSSDHTSRRGWRSGTGELRLDENITGAITRTPPGTFPRIVARVEGDNYRFIYTGDNRADNLEVIPTEEVLVGRGLWVRENKRRRLLQ